MKQGADEKGQAAAQLMSVCLQSRGIGVVNMSNTLTGTVKWFNERKGYGFIAPDDGSKDLFVHQSAILASGFRSLSEGERVEFSVTQEPKGPAATNVKEL